MAKKKEPSIDDILKEFESVMLRASLSDYYHVNNIMLSKNPKGHSVLIVPDQLLWDKIMESETLKPHISELDISKPAEQAMLSKFKYGEDLDSSLWIEIDPNELYSGKIIKIKIDGFEYDVSINKNFLPLKLKKAEFNGITYRVFFEEHIVLALKKHFIIFGMEDYGFTMIRIFTAV